MTWSTKAGKRDFWLSFPIIVENIDCSVILNHNRVHQEVYEDFFFFRLFKEMPLHLLMVLLISSTYMIGFLHFSSSRLCSNSSRSPFNSLYLDFKLVGSSPALIVEMMLFIFFVVSPILALMFLCISSLMSSAFPMDS